MEFTPEEVAEYHKENPPPVAPVAAAPKEEAPKIALSDPKLVSAVEKRAGAKPHNDYTEEKVEELSTWVGEVGKLAEEMNVPQGELINTYDKAKVKEPKPVEVAAEVTAAPVAEEALKEPVEVAHVEEKEIVPIVPEEAHVEESPKVATVPIEEVSAPPEKVAKAEEPRAPPKEKITADTISDRLMAKFNIGGNDTVSDVLGGGEKIKGGGELSDQIETGQIATQTESSLSGPAKGKVDDVAAETKHGGVAGGDKVVKTVGPGEEREAPRMRAKVETVGKGEKGVEISVADLERTINRRVIELAQSSVIRNSERFLDTYGVARENFKNGKENGLSQDESQMKGWAKEASNSREKILELLPELRNFQKMCDALKENDSESTALKGAQRTLREIEGVLARWEEA